MKPRLGLKLPSSQRNARGLDDLTVKNMASGRGGQPRRNGGDGALVDSLPKNEGEPGPKDQLLFMVVTVTNINIKWWFWNFYQYRPKPSFLGAPGRSHL